jgi:hypothetical protein
MKEFVFVEFLFDAVEYPIESAKLDALGEDFQLIKSEYEEEIDSDYIPFVKEQYMRVSGRINSMTASVIKLQNPVLAEKMRISYISDDLKDKYRK